MKSKERIAYLKGLLAGLKPREEEEQKIILALIDVVDALAAEAEEQGHVIEEQGEAIEEVADYCSELEDDMTALERRLDGLLSDEADGDEGDFLDETGEEEPFASVSCPHCGLAFFCRPEALEPDEALECPGCGESFEI